jgi:hypothetical protein
MSAHGSTHPYECLVEISCCFIVASGFGLQQKMSLSRTPVCGPHHSDACTPLHRPPPVVSTASRCHTSLCARRAQGNADFAPKSENVVKILQTSTPPENRKPLTIVKECLPVASLNPMHAWLNFRAFSPWRGGSDKGWAPKEKVWGLWKRFLHGVRPKKTVVWGM